MEWWIGAACITGGRLLLGRDVRGSLLICSSPDGSNVSLLRTQRRSSIMEILNTVFSALNLLATVVIGVINVTWMISRDVFRDKPRAKHYSKK